MLSVIAMLLCPSNSCAIFACTPMASKKHNLATARLLKKHPVPTSSPPATALAANRPRFTERELEILAAIARGERSKEIAAHLGLTRRTIETYLTSIYLKLEVDSRAAVAVALEQGILRPKES